MEADIVEALGETLAMLVALVSNRAHLVESGGEEADFQAEVLAALARGHLYRVLPTEAAESVVDTLTKSFRERYAHLVEKSAGNLGDGVKLPAGDDRSSSIGQPCERCSIATDTGLDIPLKWRESTVEHGVVSQCLEREIVGGTTVLEDITGEENGEESPKAGEKNFKGSSVEDGYVDVKSQDQCFVEEVGEPGSWRRNSLKDMNDQRPGIGRRRFIVEEAANSWCSSSLQQGDVLLQGCEVTKSARRDEVVGFGRNVRMDWWRDSVAAQERSNSLKEMELVCAMKGLQLKERELEMKEESMDIGREKLDVRKSMLDFRVSKAAVDAMTLSCDRFRKSTSDYFVAGLLLLSIFTVFCVWKNIPDWFLELRTSCGAVSFADQPWYKWRPLNAVTGNTNYVLCVARGVSGFIVGVLLSVILLYVCKKTLSSPDRGMPVSIFMVGGSAIGLIGRDIVELLGGEGSRWMAMWIFLCVVHAGTHFFTEFFVRLLARSKLLSVSFHVALAFALPLSVGLAGFPSVITSRE